MRVAGYVVGWVVGVFVSNLVEGSYIAGILTEINLFKSFFSTLFMLITGDSERRDGAFEMSMYAASAAHFYALFANL